MFVSNTISTRISEIESEMAKWGFFSPERKALEDERSRLVRAREDEFRAAREEKAPAVQVARVDPEHAVTAETWRQMHG